MDWMLLTEMSSMFCGPWHTAALSADSGAAPAEAETDLWITRQAYKFIAARTLCERCGARLSRKVSVALTLEGAGGIVVGARCRGWRRHPHAALICIGQGGDGLLFGALEPI